MSTNPVDAKVVPDYAPPEEESLRSRTVVGAGWSAIGMAGASFLSLGSSLVLTRLLLPDAFGLIATASILMAAIELFSDIGLVQAIIQHSQGDTRTYLDTAWTLQIIRGLFLSAVVAGLAYPFSRIYGDPRLLLILLVTCSSFVLRGFNSPALFLLKKELRLQRVVIMDLSCSAIRVAVTIAASLVLRSVWGLVLGGVFGQVAILVASFLVWPYRPRLSLNLKAARELIRFGRFILISGILWFLCTRLDSALIPKYLGMKSAGVYYIAVAFASMLTSLLNSVFDQALYPAFCRVKDDLERLRARQHELMEVYCGLVIPAVLVVAVNAGLIISVLYPTAYEVAGAALCWLLMAALADGLARLLNIPIMASGRSHVGTIASCGYLVGLCVTLPTLAPLWGIPGYAIAKFLASAGLLAPLLFFSLRLGHRTFREMLGHLRVPAVIAVVLILVHGPLLGGQHGGIVAKLVRAGIDTLILAVIWSTWQRDLVTTSLVELMRAVPGMLRSVLSLLPSRRQPAELR
jgi:O-antigen/teichoic acid export membrane protein